jgi:uncharacterized protein (TIGR00297 family)
MFSFESLLGAVRANFLWAIGVNVPIAAISYAAGVVRGSGLVAGLAYGLVIFTFGGYRAFLILLLFFLAGSIASKVGVARKAAAGAAEESKGARGAGSVVGKCTVGAVIAVLIGASGGSSSADDVLPAVLGLAYLGAFAAALADTLASELGPLFGGKAFLLKSFRLVPHGIPGAVSIGGTACGLIGPLLVGLLAIALGMVPGELVVILMISSLIAIMFESFLRGFCSGQSMLQKQLPNALLTLIGAISAILITFDIVVVSVP